MSRVRVQAILTHLRLLGGLTLTLCLLSATLPLAARADSQDTEARALFEKGLEASDAQHWAEAVDAFRRSLALVERPSTRFNLVTALYRQGEYREALEAAELYLAQTDPGKDAAKRAEVQKLVDEMRATMGTLLIDVEPRNAQARVDGRPIGENRPRHEVTLEPGPHEVILSADGYAPRLETVTVEKGVRTLVAIKLIPLVTAPAPGAAGAGPQVPDMAEARRRNDLQMRILELNTQITRLQEGIDAANRRKPLVLLGLGLGFAVTGVIMATANDDEGSIISGTILSLVGGSLLLSAGISGLVRRSKRNKFQHRLDDAKKEKQELQLELVAGLTPGRQMAGLALRF